MNRKKPFQKLTKEQREQKTRRRKANQHAFRRFEREMRYAERAEKILPLTMLVMLPLSFFLFADRVCGGFLSIFLLLVEIFHIVILCRFTTLWRKNFLLIICTYATSAVMIWVSSTVQSAVFAPCVPVPFFLSVWLVLLAGWLYLTLRHFDGFIISSLKFTLIALCLAVLTGLWTMRVNISFDRSTPEPITAEVIRTEALPNKGTYTYWITAEFALSSGEPAENRFCVLKTAHYKQLSSQEQITLLRRTGALGSEWYEIELPK